MKQSLILCFISAFFCSFVHAQEFKVSTADNPSWFFIQVKGATATSGLALTENNNALVGEPLRSSGLTEIAKQLWRIEQGSETNTYYLINKYSGKKPDIAYSEEKKERMAVLTETPSTEWRLFKSGNFYLLRATTQPTGGTVDAVYLTQADASKAFSYIFSTSGGSNENTQFGFLAFDSYPVISTETETAWLRIQNAQTSLSGKCLTDAGDNVANGPFLMSGINNNDPAQQWKIILKKTPFEAGKVDFVNRETGRAIGTNAVYDTYYFLPATGDWGESDGWRIRALDDTHYEIASGSATAPWFWNAGNEPPHTYTGVPDKEQGFAWTFTWVDETITGFQQAEILSGARVYVRNKMICVEGADRYTITNSFGSRIANNRPLPTGVYLVNVKGKTTKVLVK
jgi:hypothetical protein